MRCKSKMRGGVERASNDCSPPMNSGYPKVSRLVAVLTKNRKLLSRFGGALLSGA